MEYYIHIWVQRRYTAPSGVPALDAWEVVSTRVPRRRAKVSRGLFLVLREKKLLVNLQMGEAVENRPTAREDINPKLVVP